MERLEWEFRTSSEKTIMSFLSVLFEELKNVETIVRIMDGVQLQLMLFVPGLI